MSVLVGLQRGVQPETSHLKHCLVEEGLALNQGDRLCLSEAGNTLLQGLQHMLWAEVEALQQVLANRAGHAAVSQDHARSPAPTP